METIFMNTKNITTNEPHGFKLTLADKLNLKYYNENMILANLSIYYTWKKIKSEYNKNKFKIIVMEGIITGVENTFAANDFMNLTENRRAAAATYF